jgi:pimeloyl-ACP methyl ester carboxylesterase
MFRQWFLGVLLGSLLSTTLQAADVWSQIQEAGSQTLREWFPAEAEPEKKLPTEFPKDWRLSYFRDDFFDEPILVAEVGMATKPKLILVHGLGQNGMKDWLKVVPSLQADYHIVLLDLPGFSYSGQPAKKLSPTHYAQLLHRLKKTKFAQAKIAAVGHSMGGAVVLRYAELYPDDLAQIILVDAAGILQRTAFVKHSAESQVDFDINALPNPLLGYAVNAKDLGNSLIERLIKFPDPTSILRRSDKAWGAALAKTPNINAALALMEENYSAALFHLNVKTQIIWGAQDAVAPLRTGQVLAHHLSAGAIDIIAESGHTPMVTHANQFNALLIARLKQQELAKPTEINTTFMPSYNCQNQAGTEVTGRYGKVTINNCKGITLKNLQADQIVVENSLVTLQNVKINAPGDTAFIGKDSVVLGTNSEFHGKYAMEIRHCRMDLAGTQLQGSHALLIGNGKNRIVMSVSRGQLDGKAAYLHGDFVLENQRLEDVSGFNNL